VASAVNIRNETTEAASTGARMSTEKFRSTTSMAKSAAPNGA
jgi:hypothetical protein